MHAVHSDACITHAVAISHPSHCPEVFFHPLVHLFLFFFVHLRCFAAQGLSVGKHVALMSELSPVIDAKGLMDISAVEQEVAAGGDNPNDHFKMVTEALSSPSVDPFDALRLTMLYAIRYEKSRSDKVAELKRFVSDRLDMKGTMTLVDDLLRYGGAGTRTTDLFGTGSSVLSKLASNVKRGMNTVQNVYTQHQPLLTSVLDQLAKGKLSRSAFPFVGAEPPPGS